MHRPEGPGPASAPPTGAAPRDRPPSRLARLRRVLWRNTLAALLATGCDATAYQWAIRWGAWDPGLATALGALFGGIINYGINRVWTFQSTGDKLQEMLRYTCVSALGGLVSSLAVHLWAYRDPAANPTLIWGVVKCAVSWGVSLPLQRFYVFGAKRGLAAPSA